MDCFGFGVWYGCYCFGIGFECEYELCNFVLWIGGVNVDVYFCCEVLVEDFVGDLIDVVLLGKLCFFVV